jgi:hypothetical protein
MDPPLDLAMYGARNARTVSHMAVGCRGQAVTGEKTIASRIGSAVRPIPFLGEAGSSRWLHPPYARQRPRACRGSAFTRRGSVLRARAPCLELPLHRHVACGHQQVGVDEYREHAIGLVGLGEPHAHHVGREVLGERPGRAWSPETLAPPPSSAPCVASTVRRRTRGRGSDGDCVQERPRTGRR